MLNVPIYPVLFTGRSFVLAPTKSGSACPEGTEFVSKLLKSLCHSEGSEESELKTRLFAMLRVTIETFYTNSTPSGSAWLGTLIPFFFINQ